MDKSKLSESDICDKFISPALAQAGWDVIEQILREYPLRPGRMVVRGQRASRDKKSVLRADYVLFWKANIPLAVIEAKDNNQAVGAGMQQALNYAELLDVPFVFASNGDGFVFRDATLVNFNLDQKNPHAGPEVSHNPDELLAEYRRLQAEAQQIRDQLKALLGAALAGKA